MFNEDSLERELSCGICFELYNVPLQLPCMHTFCKDCLKDILRCSKSKKLKCPDCRRNIDLGKAGIESIKRNFKLASIVDIYRQAAEKLAATKEESSPQASGGKASSDTAVEKDYEFLNKVIKKSHDDAAMPFEPHIIDDLWGTFKRTTRRDSYNTSRPPAPLPPHSQTTGGQVPIATRPLPPLPRPVSRNLPHRPLPPEPPALNEQLDSPMVRPRSGQRSSTADQPTPIQRPLSQTIEQLMSTNIYTPLPSTTPSPTLPPSDEDVSSAARDFTLAETSWTPVTRLEDQSEESEESEWVDVASLFAPPLPPRRSISSPTRRSINKRPPIPVPRSQISSPPLPNRGAERQVGNLMDSRRPPTLVPRSKKS